MNSKNLFFGIFATILGIATYLCAENDYDWFMNSNKAKFFVNLLGRDGARLFYKILGVFITILGILLVMISF